LPEFEDIVSTGGMEKALSTLSLEGRTAVIIGGTSGIGLALSLGLAEAGADVVASARRPEQVAETADKIEALGRLTLRVASDVGDRASLERLCAETLDAFGKVDILVNCAGKIKRAPTLTFPEAEWQSIMDTNLTGTLRACQIFGAPMLERGYGRIVNIASLNTFVSLAEVAAYAASKAAVAALTRSLAVEWSKHGVCVNAVAPGVFRTALNAELLDSTPRGWAASARPKRLSAPSYFWPRKQPRSSADKRSLSMAAFWRAA
jgi:NAD(P)-dependent dehydrogenase (short-subunit alcohol dehydrogenase family)